MRALLGERIVGLCKEQARKLNTWVSGRLFHAPQILSASTSQSEFGDFDFEEPEQDSGSGQEIQSQDSIQSENDDDETNSVDEDKPRGLIYARVSSQKQLDSESEDEDYDEGSIAGQVEDLTELAKNEGIHLPLDPITDEAETGTNFDRDGIQKVFNYSKNNDIDYLLVEKIDRIGRNAPETLYFLYILQSECGVTVLTPSAEHDMNKTEGLMHATLLSLMAEVQNDLRTTKAKKERIRGFLKKKKWHCKSPVVPLGYNLTKDGWLEVNPSEKKIVRDLFRMFVECETYSETKRYIDNEYGSDTLDGHQVKTLLTDRVYIGEPRLPEEWIKETTFENELEEPSLHLLKENDSSPIDVSEETFREAQDIINKKNIKHSSNEDTQKILDFVEEFSLFSVIKASEPATLLHHCGEPLVADGQRDLKGRKVHRYRCRNCEETVDAESYYRRWPKGHELDKMELIQQILDDEYVFDK